MIKPTTRKNKKASKFTTIRHKRKYRTRKQTAGNPPVLNSINSDELKYFYDYFGPNFLENCEKPDEVKLITQNDKQLCEQFGLQMLKKVSLISGIYKLQDELQVQERVELSPAEILKLNLFINDRQSKKCEDDMSETNPINASVKEKLITLLDNVYNINIIKRATQKIVSQPNIDTSTHDKLKEYFENCTDADYSDAGNLVKDVITEFYFGNNPNNCQITKEIMTLLKIITAIIKLIEQHKIPQPTSQSNANNNSSSSLYLYDLLEYAINELKTKLEEFANTNSNKYKLQDNAKSSNQSGGSGEIVFPEEEILYNFNGEFNNELQGDFALSRLIYTAITQIGNTKFSGTKSIVYGLAAIGIISAAVGGVIFLSLYAAPIGALAIYAGYKSYKKIKEKLWKSDNIQTITRYLKEYLNENILQKLIADIRYDESAQVCNLNKQKNFLESSYDDLTNTNTELKLQDKLKTQLRQKLMLIVNYKDGI